MSEKSKKSAEPLIVLITGASGSGKTSVAQVLEQKFSKKTTSLYYFDDIGVPSTTKMIETMVREKNGSNGQPQDG